MLALAVLALFIFGPDKLPKVAADAGRMLRQLRQMAQGAKDEVSGSLGSEFADLNLSDLDPRAFVKRQLLDERDDLDRAINDQPEARPPIPAAGDDASAARKPPAPNGYDGDAT